MPIDIIVRADIEQAEAELKRLERLVHNAERENANIAKRNRDRFKNMAINISQSFSGGAGSAVGMLAMIAHPAAIATAAIVGLGGAFAAMANKAAEANREGSAEAKKFLIGIQNLKAGFEDFVNWLGAKAIPVFNFIFEKFGVNTEKAKLTTEQIKELKEEQKAWAEESRKAFEEFDKGISAAFEAGNIEALRELDEKILAFARNTKEVAGQLLIVDERVFQLALHAEMLRDILAKQAQSELYIKYWQNINKEFDKNTKQIEAAIQASLDLETTLAREDIEAVAERRAEHEEKVADELKKQREIHADIVNSIGQAAMQAKNFNDFLQKATFAVLTIIAQMALSRTPFGFLGSILPFQHGGIVKRPTRAVIGEAGPEAVVPLSPGKAPQREAVMQAAGLSSNAVTLNISMPNVRNVDQLAIRNALLPAINKQIRRGEKLLASKLR